MASYKQISLAVLALAMVLLLVKCNINHVAGGGTETGNPAMIAGILYQPDGITPAAGVRVFIRPKSLLADTSGTGIPKKLADSGSVITNDAGLYAFDTTLNTGTYVIEAASGNNAVLIDSVAVVSKDTTDSLAADTLKPAGALKGIVYLSEGGDPRKVFILAFGIDRFVRVEADGSFRFENLAEAAYDLRIISSLDEYGVIDTVGVAVRSGDTTDLDTIELPFTGIPTPKALTASYDTLTNNVSLSWATANPDLVNGYKIYRREGTIGQYALANDSQLSTASFVDNLANGLEKGKTYQYMVRAIDKNENEGLNSDPVTVRIAFFVDAGKDTAYHLGDSVTLKARIDSTTITPTEYRFDANGDGTNDLVSATATTFKYAYADTGTYKAVITIQASSRTFSDTVRITIVPKDTAGAPVAPKALSLSYDTLKQIVTLTWIRNLENDIKGFNVYRKHSDSALVKINTVLITGTTFSDSTPTQDQTYEYKIAAVDNADNEGEKSAGVSVSVKPPFTFVASLSQVTLLTPQDMVFNDSIVMVVEYDSSFLFTLDTANRIISTVKLKDSSQTPIIYPTGIAFDNQAIYIAAENGLFKYDRNGAYQQKFQTTTSRPNRVAVLDSFIYITTDLNIAKYRKDGTIVLQFSSYGTGTDQIKNPKGIVVVGDSVFVCDRDNNRIQIFSTNGIYQGKWGTYGLANGQFDRPTAIAKDQTNNLYVVDQGNNRVQVFNRAEGICITKFAIDNASANTRGIAINSSGDVILAVGNALKLYGRN